MLDQQTLDRLWNFDDPAGSEHRFRDAAADGTYDADEQAELATQLGRAIGLQGRYEEADALLDAIDCGRTHSGRPGAAGTRPAAELQRPCRDGRAAV